MGKPYVYLYKDNGYSNRHRTYTMPDGSQLTAHITRYTYQMFYKPCKGPRGGKAKKQCARSIYYKAGVFYRAQNIQLVEGGDWINSLAPFEGVMWDAHQTTSQKQGVPIVAIECVEGVPVEVKDSDGCTIWQWGDPIAELEDLLHIPAQDRTPEAIEQPEQPEAVEADTATAAEAIAATDEWLAALTTEGEQMGLDLWASYKDAIALNLSAA